jgi:23S rRNA pseudouridine1911/1915/1917 synthase
VQETRFTVPLNLSLLRLDKALSTLNTGVSRSSVQKAIKNGHVTLNNVIIKDSSILVKEHDIIELNLPEEAPLNMQATNIALDILYEDEDLMVINKPAGLTVHPGAGNYHDTLANALIYYSNSLSDVGGFTRPGIVHRLDKDTSGLMVVAKNNFAHASLSNQIEKRQLVRNYKALVWGMINPTSGTIETNIGRDRVNRQKMSALKLGGKKAITHYHTERIFLGGLMSLVICKLETGRTHQIRVHLSHVGHSVVGDQAYGQNARKINKLPLEIKEKLVNFKRQALHSYCIAFNHPRTNKFFEFSIDLPHDMKRIVDLLKN